jgi:membrane protease YdiL (CAAX protease family)
MPAFRASTSIKLGITVAIFIVYYGFSSLVFQILLGFATVVANDSPWPLLGGMAVCASALAFPGESLSSWPIFTKQMKGFWGIHFASFCASSIVIYFTLTIINVTLFGSPDWLPGVLPGVSRPIALALAVGSPVVAAVIEEIAFRGILQSRLTAILGARVAIIVTTVFFVASHFINPGQIQQICPYVAFSFASCFLASISKSIAPSMFLHLAINSTVVVLGLLTGSIGKFSSPWIVEVGGTAICAASLFWVWDSGTKLRKQVELRAAPPDR